MGMALGDERAGFAPSDSDDGSDSEGERLERQLAAKTDEKDAVRARELEANKEANNK